jgi:hypothetical protein
LPTAPVPQAPAVPTAPVPSAAGVPQFAPVVSEKSKKSGPLKWIIPIVAVAAVGAGLFVFLGRDDDGGGGGGGFGVTEGELSEDEPVVSATVKLKPGEAIRLRAEPERRLDIRVVVFADSDTAEAYAEALFDVAEGEDDFPFTDPDDISDLLFTDGDELITDNDLSDQVALAVLDDESSGKFEADFFPALAAGTYTVAVIGEQQDDEGEVRLIIEKLSNTFDPDDSFSDIDEFFSDDDELTSDDPFFTEDGRFDPES